MIPANIKGFLEKVQSRASGFESIRLGTTVAWLTHAFWSFDEILDGLSLRAEWGISDDLIPFYGDWHTVICVSAEDGRVQLLDDLRRSQFEWDSRDSFLASLTHRPSEPAESQPRLISSDVSDELDAMIKNYVASRPE